VFHRHVWEVVSRTEQPAPAEISMNTGLTLKAKGLYSEDIMELVRRPVIVHRKCTKCNTEEVRRV
jgi:hypothetical protein